MHTDWKPGYAKRRPGSGAALAFGDRFTPSVRGQRPPAKRRFRALRRRAAACFRFLASLGFS